MTALGVERRTPRTRHFSLTGANAVQELSGTTATANLISGGVDQIFIRADATGSFAPLKDILGSTIALADTNGNVVTHYAYDPFGNSTFSGSVNSNVFQYTGRENEGNGIYFYRARYYSAVLGRFINEDPIRFGNNFYRYVSDDPINFWDPFGLRDYNEQETLQWLQNAYDASTVGYFQGLWNIRNNSQGGGPYDFGHDPTGVHQGDTWTRCGIKMSAGDFGNYIAGFQAGAWDRKFNQAVPGTTFAIGLVKLADIYYHLTGDTDVPNDPWDKTGMPWINSGIDDGFNFHSYPLENPIFYPKDGGKCGCK
jgi:RHS repeat-associated protein